MKRRTRTEPGYFSERRAWNDHVGRVVRERTLWQTIGILSALTALLSLGVTARLALESRFVPYIVEVDKLGWFRAVQPLSTTRVSDKLVGRFVEDFVANSRRVTADVELQREMVMRAFAMVQDGSSAAGKLAANFEGQRQPFERGKVETVSVELVATTRVTEESWQVDWRETVYDHEGHPLEGPWLMRGTVRLAQRQYSGALDLEQLAVQGTSDEAEFRENPFGIWVVEYDWTAITESVQ